MTRRRRFRCRIMQHRHNHSDQLHSRYKCRNGRYWRRYTRWTWQPELSRLWREWRSSGIYSGVQLLVSSCTIVSNKAIGGMGGSGGMSGGLHGGAYGGIRSAAGNSTIRNTIIADNTAQQARDISGVFVSQGFNLVGTTNGGTGFGVTFDQVGTTNSPIHPLVNPLQDNGGATWTFELQTNSPAIDQSDSFGETSHP